MIWYDLSCPMCELLTASSGRVKDLYNKNGDLIWSDLMWSVMSDVWTSDSVVEESQRFHGGDHGRIQGLRRILGGKGGVGGGARGVFPGRYGQGPAKGASDFFFHFPLFFFFPPSVFVFLVAVLVLGLFLNVISWQNYRLHAELLSEWQGFKLRLRFRGVPWYCGQEF